MTSVCASAGEIAQIVKLERYEKGRRTHRGVAFKRDPYPMVALPILSFLFKDIDSATIVQRFLAGSA
jgi:hypothetical protein